MNGIDREMINIIIFLTVFRSKTRRWLRNQIAACVDREGRPLAVPGGAVLVEKCPAGQLYAADAALGVLVDLHLKALPEALVTRRTRELQHLLVNDFVMAPQVGTVVEAPTAKCAEHSVQGRHLQNTSVNSPLDGCHFR